MRSRFRLLLLLASTAAAVMVTATAADAHTTARAEAGPAGATVVTWSFSHGCEGRPTIGLRVRIPAGARNVTAADAPGWTANVSPTEIHWTGGSIPDGTTARFTASMVLAESAGTTVTMPAVQECTGGAELAWIASPSTIDGTESTRPAPTIVVPVNDTQPPVTSAPTTTAVTAVTEGPTTTRPKIGADAVTREGSPSSSSGLWVFVLVCAVIVGGAGGLFLRQRRRGQSAGGES